MNFSYNIALAQNIVLPRLYLLPNIRRVGRFIFAASLHSIMTYNNNNNNNNKKDSCGAPLNWIKT